MLHEVLVERPHHLDVVRVRIRVLQRSGGAPPHAGRRRHVGDQQQPLLPLPPLCERLVEPAARAAVARFPTMGDFRGNNATGRGPHRQSGSSHGRSTSASMPCSTGSASTPLLKTCTSSKMTTSLGCVDRKVATSRRTEKKGTPVNVWHAAQWLPLNPAPKRAITFGVRYHRRVPCSGTHGNDGK